MPPATAGSPKTGCKRRAPMSCDRCKGRKTKCVGPVPGPCQFCASIGAACHLDPSRRRQRPYYHVSEEEFRYMTKALEHFLPNTELNLHSLKDVVQSFDAPAKAATADCPPPYSAAPPETASTTATTPVPSSSSASSSSSSSTSSSSSAKSAADITIEEIDELHSGLGWLRVDSKGNYRHVGAGSAYGFHVTVRSLGKRRASAAAAAATAQLPLPLPMSMPSPSDSASAASAATTAALTTGGVPSPRPSHRSLSLSLPTPGRRQQIFLPRRDLCNRCVSRFFHDVQSVYWFWSAERFYAVLDGLYAGDPASATPAVLCSLYAILALTCESEAAKSQGTADLLLTADPPPAAKYVSLAKALVPALCDEADADSARALCLLGLALQNGMHNNTAYIYVGAAARIALTLGLHLARAGTVEPLKGCLQRQVDLRLYSTLYLLDLDIAISYGNPPAITTAEHAASKPQDLSEQILSPGSHMPLDYLAVSCHLAQIKRQLSVLLYDRTHLSSSSSPSPSRSSSPPRLSASAVGDSLQRLRAWHDSIPVHLRDVPSAAPFHQRSVSVLHLRYWSTTVFATRPFLLYSALHPDAFAALPAVKRASFEELGRVCLDAAKQSMGVIAIMRERGLLSSLTTLDAGFVLENLQVFLLLLLPLPWGAPGDCDDVRTCLQTLQGMEQVLWTSKALTEVMAQLAENGLLNDDNAFSPGAAAGTLGDSYLGASQAQQLQLNQQQQQNTMISGVLEAYFSDLSDPFFDVDDGTAAPMLTDHYDAMDGMTI